MTAIQTHGRLIEPSQMVLSYVLLLPMLFFAAGGVFSFESKLAKTQSGAYENSVTATQSASEPIQRASEVLCCLSSIACCVAASYRSVAKSFVMLLPFLWIVIWAAISTIWSLDPVGSARNAGYLLLNTTFAFYINRRYSAQNQMRFFTFVGSVFLAANYLTCLLFPRYGITPSALDGETWQGICVHKNVCAYMTVFLLSPVLCSRAFTPLGRLLRWIYVSASLVLIVLTGSRTGWILAGFLMLIVPSLRLFRGFAKRDATIIAVACAPLGILFAWMCWNFLPAFFSVIGKDPTMNGRLPIWTAVLTSILKHPLIGYGYRAFWHSGMAGESGSIATKVGWNPNFAHNGLLEIGLELGGVGMCLVLWSLVQALRNAKVCFRHAESSVIDWYLCIVLMTIVVNIDEGTLLEGAHLGWTMYAFACAGLAASAARIHSNYRGVTCCEEAQNSLN